MILPRNKPFYNTPVMGLLSGSMSPAFLWIHHLLTDELLLKAVAGLGVWTAAFVSILSLIIYTVKVYDIARSRLKRKKQNEKLSENL